MRKVTFGLSVVVVMALAVLIYDPLHLVQPLADSVPEGASRWSHVRGTRPPPLGTPISFPEAAARVDFWLPEPDLPIPREYDFRGVVLRGDTAYLIYTQEPLTGEESLTDIKLSGGIALMVTRTDMPPEVICKVQAQISQSFTCLYIANQPVVFYEVEDLYTSALFIHNGVSIWVYGYGDIIAEALLTGQ